MPTGAPGLLKLTIPGQSSAVAARPLQVVTSLLPERPDVRSVGDKDTRNEMAGRYVENAARSAGRLPEQVRSARHGWRVPAAA
jgi:hypothetical protein